ncbi:MAG: protein kinase [Ktedonobacteraceae bacterium]
MQNDFIGQTLAGRYEIQSLISSGGMGIVYEARDHKLHRQVAVKLVQPEYIWSSEMIEGFIQEAQIIGQLEHPNILKVFDLGETEDDACPIFLVMQLAHGSMKDKLNHRISPEEAVPILEQVSRALDYAHSQGVIHLEIKPSNILFDLQGNALVADFGLAKLLHHVTHVKADTGAGTEDYMPPEQYYGSDAGPFSDVYALGMTLHEMLTGKVPERTWENGSLILHLDASLSDPIKAVILKATQPDVHVRYQTAGELWRVFVKVVHPTFIQQPVTVPSGEAIAPNPPLLPAPIAPDLDKLREALRDMGQFCDDHPDINERELVNYAFKPDGLFATLGYDEPLKKVLLEHQQADVVLRAFNGRPLAVVEFKRPNRSPNDGFDQLENNYIARLLPDVGVLCNGRELWIYRRTNNRLFRPPVLRITCERASVGETEALYNWLGWREIDLTDYQVVVNLLRNFTRSPIPVRGPTEPGGLAFLDRLALRPSTPFGRLVAAMAEALPAMFEKSGFARGAYAFWRRIYARELSPGDIPETWKALLPIFQGNDRQEAHYYLMFALESAYAVLSRLLLAQAMENHDFPHLELTDTLLSALRIQRVHGRIPPSGYAATLKEVFRYTGEQALHALFDSDIFDWWHDLAKAPDASPVGERLAEALLAVFEFDFKEMNGDLLGGLYQSYFDAESRKALGEFYTPPEVVDFLLDEVGYVPSDPDLPTKRLLDPSCGSGTILVHALRRYLAAAQGRSAGEILRDLLGGLKIVGFDINPFAVLMARANYAAQIIPLYVQAMKAGVSLPTLSIPVLRTDSLRQEYREGEATASRSGEVRQALLISQDDDVTLISTELPVEISPGEFFHTDIPVPRYDKARAHGWVRNPEDYFAALNVLFEMVGVGDSDVRSLQNRLRAAGLRQELAEYMHQAALKLVQEMQRLRDQYDDGRFLRTMADLAMALILKNDIWYHYVVGNPPYIRIQSVPQRIRGRWETWYHWADGNFDAYVPFMERAIYIPSQPHGPNFHEWLAPGGKLAFICSNRFLLANYAEELRAALPRNAQVELLLDMRDSRVFENALNYPAILIVRRLEQGEIAAPTFAAVRVFADPRHGVQELLTETRSLLAEIRQGIPHARGDIADAFPANSNDLRRSSWLLMPPDERRVFAKLEQAATFADVASCPICRHLTITEQTLHHHVIRLADVTTTQSGAFQGIATGDDDALILRVLEDRGATLLLRPKGAGKPDWHGPDEVEIERALLRPWLFGRDLQRWYAAWDNWYVFYPYAQITALEKHGKQEIPITRYRLIPSSDALDIFRKNHKYQDEFPVLDRQYPKAWQYLTHPFIAQRLRRRERDLREADSTLAYRWYELARPQNLEKFNLPKLLIQISSTEPDFVFDPDQHFLLQHGGRGGGTDGIVFKSFVDDWLVLALLNSSTLDYYLKHVSVVFSGKAYSYSDAFIKQLPIKLPANDVEQEQAQNIAQLARQLTELTNIVEARKRNCDAFPQPQVRALPAKYDLYPLSRLVQGKPQASTLKRDEVSFQPTLDGKIAMRFGKSTLILPHEQMAEIVRTWLKLQSQAILRVADLLALTVPSNKTACQQVVSTLENLEREIAALQAQIIQGEADLNSQVADYHGLSEEDRQIVTDFLVRF